MDILSKFIFCLSLITASAESTNLHGVNKFPGNEKLFQLMTQKIQALENKNVEYSKALNQVEHTCNARIDALREEFTEKTKDASRMFDEQPSVSDGINSVTKGHLASAHQITIDDNDVRIAFFAKLSNHTHHLGLNQNIVFDNVVTNYGNGYLKQNGTFFAPLSGVYVISTTLMTYDRSSGHFGIYINDKLETWFFLDGTNNAWDKGTHNIIVHLSEGDQVSVQSTDADREIAGFFNCLFSGFMLYLD